MIKSISSLEGAASPLRTQFSRFKWSLHRASVKQGLGRDFSTNVAQRWLIISEPDPICAAQVFPFFYYAADLRETHGIEVREISMREFLVKARYAGNVDVVCFQTWFDCSASQLRELIDRLRDTYPGARLVYLDWFAPTDLRFAETLDPQIDFYVKKHMMRDRSVYRRTNMGETNLTDYYSKRFDIPLGPVTFHIPDTFWEKLILGPNFALSPQMLPLLSKTPQQLNRPIDVHARIAVKGSPWYTAMRTEALEATQQLKGMQVVYQGKISRAEYIRELYSSKLCFSPFGYGEVCWRDYEAAVTGAMLIKPDMSHVETMPDIFHPMQTYVPVQWDLSDLEEKIRYYLVHTEERLAIAEKCRDVIQQYISGGCFLGQMDRMSTNRYRPDTQG